MNKISLMFRLFLSGLIFFLSSCKSKPTVKAVKDYPELNKIIATFFENRSASLVYYSYLVKHDKQPLRLTFIFYKPKGEWKALRFKFDDEVTTELEQSGKLYFLQ